MVVENFHGWLGPGATTSWALNWDWCRWALKAYGVLLASPPLRDCTTTNFSTEKTRIDKADAAVLRRLGMKRGGNGAFSNGDHVCGLMIISCEKRNVP